ncbi:MAG: glycoside hydrolase family 43 protein [Pirellulales bacterium]|nr:glycoside hydrolase family 43 protein [Pirellulales bacterium]
MFRTIAIAGWFACLAVTGASRGAEPTFQNPIQAGFYPDPSVCRAGDDYYLVHSTFEYFPGAPIFHSRDLVHWRQIGHCLDRPSQLNLEKMRPSAGIFAPTIRHHDGVFYLVTTNVWGGGNFFCTATDPAGPWSEPVWLDREGIDPSLFFDDDGTVYYMRHVGGGDGYIGLQQLDLAAGKLVGEMKEIWRGTGGVWAEGPHLYKRDGWYYVLIAEGGTSFNHAVTIARSKSPWGPYESCPRNPILTHVDRPEHPVQALGHADFVETPAGWWTVFLGIRPQGGRVHHLGRETFLAPVVWDDDGWPTIGTAGKMEIETPAPALPPHPWPTLPQRDEFEAPKLDFAWNFLRNPRAEDWSLSERPGYLRLHGSAVPLGAQDSPAFVGRRQTALACIVQTKLSFDPQSDGEEAGLVVRGNDANYYALVVTRRDGGRTATLRRVLKGEVVGPVELRPLPPGDVVLKVIASPTEYQFFCITAGGEALPLGGASPQDLSSERIGGFTGVYLGMFAAGPGQRASTPADFDWFDFEVVER